MSIENNVKTEAERDFDVAVENANKDISVGSYSWSPGGDPDALSPGNFSMQSSKSYRICKDYDIDPASYYVI